MRSVLPWARTWFLINVEGSQNLPHSGIYSVGHSDTAYANVSVGLQRKAAALGFWNLTLPGAF